MAEVAQAYVSLLFSARGADRNIERAIGGGADRAGRRAGDKAGKAFGGAFSGALKGVVAGVAALGVGRAAVGLIGDSIAAASDLNETATKTEAIFGDATKAVNAFADQGAKKLGQSRLEVLNAAATFGAFGKAAKLTGPDLAEFSTGLVGLSTDLASFNNTSPEEAVQAIGAALRGESEPIRKYNVLLDDATLRQQALRLGLIKTTKQALTPQQKVLAAQAEIYRQTTDAQGDFIKTSDGLANKQRTLTAQVADLKGELGKGLLPIANKVVSKTSELVEGFQDGTGAGGDLRDIAEDLADGLKDAAEFGKDVFKAIDSLPGPVKKFGAELAIGLVVMSKLRTLTGPMSAGLATMATNFRNAETRAAGLKTGLRGLGSGLTNIAGAGGVLLLADSTNEASEGLGVLKGAAGGALSGAALGAFAGPPGAAIGAGIGAIAGGIFSLATNAEKSGVAAEGATPPLERYMAAIEGGADAITRFNTQQAIKNLGADALAAGRSLGILPETLARATQGSPKAIAAVNEALKKARGQIKPTTFTVNALGQVVQELDLKSGSLRKSVDDVSTALGINQIAYRKDVTAANDAALAVGDYAEVLPGLDREVQTKIALLGLSNARNSIVDLTRKYDLAREDVRTILEASGYVPTRDKIDDIITRANELDGKQVTVGIGVLLTNGGRFDPLGFNKRSALGNTYRPGDIHLVGERGPELFTSSTAGRIKSNNDLNKMGGDTVGALTITNWHDGTGYFSMVADERVGAQRGIDSMTERAFG